MSESGLTEIDFKRVAVLAVVDSVNSGSPET